MPRKHLLWWYSLTCPQTSCWRRNDIYLLQLPRHSSKEDRVRKKVHTIQNAFSLFVFFGKCSFNLLLLLETMLIPISPTIAMNHWRPDKSFHRSSLIDVSTLLEELIEISNSAISWIWTNIFISRCYKSWQNDSRPCLLSLFKTILIALSKTSLRPWRR